MFSDTNSMPLGAVGAVGGVLGMLCLTAALYIFSQFIMSLLHLHKPGKIDRAIGGSLGVIGVMTISLALFIFTLKTFPAFMNGFLYKSFSSPYARPPVVYVYPYFSDFIDHRMAGLMIGLSGNDFIARIAIGGKTGMSGENMSKLLEQIKGVDLKKVLQLQKAASALDPDEVKKLLTAYKSGDMSKERLRDQLNNPDIKKLSGEAPNKAAE